jgi:hypothetical protein
MKKILFFILSLFCYHELINASTSRKRTHFRGYEDDDSEESEEASVYTGRPSILSRRRTNDQLSNQDINQRLASLSEDIREEKEPSRKQELIQEETFYKTLLRERQNQEKSPSNALKQGFSKGMRGQGCTASEDIPTIAVEAVTHKFFSPLGKVISQKGLTFWEKIFDTLENGATSILELLGLTPTISLKDVVRWQTSCQSLADNYKDLRKSIETSESRTTSMQLRSLLQDDDEESENEKEKSSSKEKALLIDPVWQRKQQGDLILLTSIVFKLKIKKHETSSSNYDLHAAIDRLQSDLTGIIEQIESVLVLRDLIDTTRTQLMISYFAAIDAGLTELGMIIAPDQFDPSPSRRKKNSYLSNDF